MIYQGRLDLDYYITFYTIVAIQHQYQVISLTPTLSCLLNTSCSNDQKNIYVVFIAASVLLGCILENSAKYIVFPPSEIPPGYHKYPLISRLPHYSKSKDSRSWKFVNFKIRDFYPAKKSYCWLLLWLVKGRKFLSNLQSITWLLCMNFMWYASKHLKSSVSTNFLVDGIA